MPDSSNRRRGVVLAVMLLAGGLLLAGAPASLAATVAGRQVSVTYPDLRVAPTSGCAKYPVSLRPLIGTFAGYDSVEIELRDATGLILGSAFEYASQPGTAELREDVQVCAFELPGSIAPYSLVAAFDPGTDSTWTAETITIPWYWTAAPTPTPSPTPGPTTSPPPRPVLPLTVTRQVAVLTPATCRNASVLARGQARSVPGVRLTGTVAARIGTTWTYVRSTTVAKAAITLTYRDCAGIAGLVDQGVRSYRFTVRATAPGWQPTTGSAIIPVRRR